MADAPKPKGGFTRKQWLIAGGLAAAVVAFLWWRSRQASASAATATGATDTLGSSGADNGTTSPYLGGTPSGNSADGSGGTSASSTDTATLLSSLLASENELVGSSFNTLAGSFASSEGTLASVIGSQDALIGELGTGAQTLAMNADQQLGSIAGSAVGGLVTLATTHGSNAAPPPPEQTTPAVTPAPQTEPNPGVQASTSSYHPTVNAAAVGQQDMAIHDRLAASMPAVASGRVLTKGPQ